MDETQALTALFGDEDDFVLAALVAADETEDGRPLSDAEIESLMREQWGLAPLDVSSAMREMTAGRGGVTPDDGESDDFSDEEWLIVQAMRKKCLDAIRADTPASRFQKAVNWLFVRNTEDSKGVSFHLACQALRSRYWVIQALIQHFWYLRGITPPQGLPFMADKLPEALESEAILHGWDAGLQIATAVWGRPGVTSVQLRPHVKVDDESYARSFDALIEAGVIGNRTGALYVTSRPATFRRSGSGVSWSRSFIGED